MLFTTIENSPHRNEETKLTRVFVDSESWSCSTDLPLRSPKQTRWILRLQPPASQQTMMPLSTPKTDSRPCPRCLAAASSAARPDQGAPRARLDTQASA